MENHRPNLIIISISMMYWFKTSVDCWKFDARFAAAAAGGGGSGGPANGNNANNGGGGGGVSILNPNQDILYACPLNSMCQCAGMPNETSTLIEINCNEVALYKFPEFLHSSVRYIEMSRTHLQSVEDETFQGLRLETLKLFDNKLQEISDRSFSTMSHTLMTLDISGNQLQHLPLDALRNLHALTRLVAQRNHITSLDGNWGSLSETLRSLHLSGNQITEIAPNQHDSSSSPSVVVDQRANSSSGPASLASATIISSSSAAIPISLLSAGNGASSGSGGPFNHITRPFAKLRKLLWLDVSNNRIYHIAANFLPRTLVTVDLSRNLLATYPQQLFEHLYDLRIISLRDNLIRNVQTKELRLVRMRLDKLDLGMNVIDELATDWFQNNYSDVRVRALNLEKNFIAAIPPSAFSGTGIVHLVMAFNAIERIHIQGFDGIADSLEYLDLERNRLQSIPGALRRLHKLKYLYLTSNAIAQLTNLPESPSNLRVLSLSGNNFTAIPADGLRNFTELSYLNMGYNSIAEIPENIFLGWGSQLQTILLRNNKVTHLPYGAFNGLHEIKEISLSFNDITIVNPYIFENISRTLKILELSFAVFPARNMESMDPLDSLLPLTELMWLGLDNNNLKVLTNESFATMRELSYINLGFNQIAHLPKGVFIPEVHRHLVEIDLSYNAVDRIPTASFNNLDEIQTINLQSNKIRTLDRHSFFKLEYLSYIDLSYNRLRNISDGALAFLPRLTQLDMMHNSLCAISLKMFHYVSNISTPLKLNVSHNRIANFDDDLTSYMYIYKLDISHNLIRNALSFSNLGNTLRVLNLMSNSLSTLGNHAFGDLEFLEVLNLSENNLTSLRRRSFQGLNSLQELDLSLNQLEQLQVEQFSNLRKLRILKIGDNKLRALPREVFMNTRLEYLDIANNQLSVWPVPAFSDVGFTLRSIQFSGNNLEYLDSSMFINSQFLYDLNLSGNKMTVLPDNTFMFLNNLTNLDLSYNPLVTSNLREVFIHTPRLKYLNLQGMGLYVLPHLNLPYLSRLDMSSNFIQEIYPFHEMHMLRMVNASHNKIANMSSIVDYLPASIRTLDLAHNPIRRITMHDMIALRHLDELNILDAKIANPMVFSKLRSLRKLTITSSQYLGDIVSRMLGLHELHVHVVESYIGREMFAKMINNTKLNVIEIYGVNVQTIASNAFEGLARTHRLRVKIAETKISDLPPGIFYTLRSVPMLSIDISDNRIVALAADSFYPNKTYWDTVGTRSILGGLDTTNNPLECECGLVWFGHWLRRWLRESAQIKVIQKDEMKRMVQRARHNTCHDPATGKKLPILEIFPEDLLCQASALSSSGGKLFLLSFAVVILPVFTISLRLLA